ncbi:MAG: NAD(P)H-binding protein [Ahrensia sp.]|nr:NAD(P)H-binding protein [Ahrensia sp.]
MKSPENKLQRVLLAGATGTIGDFRSPVRLSRVVLTLRALCGKGRGTTHLPADARIIEGDLTQTATFGDDDFDIVISCLASRSGVKADAWAVDYRANLNLLTIANETGAGQFILLSAICVQRPKLEFQKAKLAFEEALTKSGLRYQIVRPTAFFKSLSGQVKKSSAAKVFSFSAMEKSQAANRSVIVIWPILLLTKLATQKPLARFCPSVGLALPSRRLIRRLICSP